MAAKKKAGTLGDPLTAKLASARAEFVNGALWARNERLADGDYLAALPAGRELDAIAAFQVLGWKVSESPAEIGGVWTGGWELMGIPPGKLPNGAPLKIRGVPKFSGTDDGMGQLLDALRLEADEPFGLAWDGAGWAARLWEREEGEPARGTTRAHAVTLAAVLRAVGAHRRTAEGSDKEIPYRSSPGAPETSAPTNATPELTLEPAAPPTAEVSESSPAVKPVFENLSRRERKRIESRSSQENAAS